MKISKFVLFLGLFFVLGFASLMGSNASAATPKVLSDALTAAKNLDKYTMGSGATGKNVPSTYLSTAKSKYSYALKILTASQEKTYASTLKSIKASIDRGTYYVAAVQGGQTLNSYKLKIDAAAKAGKADTGLLVTLNIENSAQNARLNKVSPAAIRTKIDNNYSKGAKWVLSTYSKALSVKLQINEANKRLSGSADFIAPYYKSAMINRTEIPQAIYKAALNAEFNKLHAAVASKAKTGKLGAYYQLEVELTRLDGLISPGITDRQVPDLTKSIQVQINSSYYSSTEKSLLNKRLNSILGQVKISKAQIKQKLTAAAIKKGVEIPPEIVKSIAYKESGFKQFTDDGKPFISSDGGIGIMQVTPNATGKDSREWEKAKYNIVTNIQIGIDILLEKWNYAGSELPIINDHNKAVLEDWYFAIMAYNGISYTNDPNKTSNAYQLGVYDYIIQRAQLNPEVLNKANVKVTQNPDKLGYYIDANAKYTTSRQTRSTQMYTAGTKYTLKKGVTYRTQPTTQAGSKYTLTANTQVTIVQTGIEDTMNDDNLLNWYKVQIPGKSGYWYVASPNFP
ncbi:transglycosylase SLT domain-containing protein [Peribacillus kribbensis]|uniref:transglycosylase SLT domain-containing protein n=1 Tax=Peribacillus kribbensis TaxID=356658 RepID=UPI0006852231|nr:transglycosylase SLT domain-containing protein [Peribacillus kribbensis]